MLPCRKTKHQQICRGHHQMWRSHENKGQTSWHSWGCHVALPEALGIAVSRGRLSSQQWSHRHLLLLFAWRGIITVPDMGLTVQGPLLPCCSNTFKEVCATREQKTVTALFPIPLLPLDTGNLATHGCCCFLFEHPCTWSSWGRQKLCSCSCSTPAVVAHHLS